MNLASVSEFVGKYMAVIILAVAALTLFWPESGLWVQLTWVDYLLMIVMFGMGLSLKVSDFKVVFTHPKFLLVACLAQFIIMPLTAYFLGKLFALETGLLIGVVLVGCCPGGTASNVMTYLAKGDVALSVGMTALNTLIAPLLTPLLVFFYLQEDVDVDMLVMFKSMVKVVVVPLALGFIINHFAGEHTQKATSLLPMVSIAAISLIVAAVVSNNSQRILDSSLVIIVVVILHNLIGYAGGYLVGVLLHAPLAQRKAHTIEIGMQNSGLAVTLAKASFAAYPMAMVPGALFSVWHNISGAILANFFSRMEDDTSTDSEENEAA